MNSHQSAGMAVSAAPETHVGKAHGNKLAVARAVVSRLALMAFGMLSMLTLGGCEVIKGIFKAGVWSGVILVVVGIAVVGGIAAMVMKKR